MEFKGTKGFWVTDDNYEGFVLTDCGAYKPNAMLQSCATKEELKANAKLIAAAPYLLAACQEVLDSLNGAEYAIPCANIVEKAIERALGK